MKQIFLLLLSLAFFASCETEKLDAAKAQKIGEDLILQIDKGNYSEAFKHYTADFNKAVPEQERIEQFKRLKNAMGEVTSLKLADTKNQAEVGERANVILTFEVEHSRVKSKETLIIIEDEGDYRVANHSIIGE